MDGSLTTNPHLRPPSLFEPSLSHSILASTVRNIIFTQHHNIITMSISTPDPRSLPPDPRLPYPSLYSQDVCVAAITSLYESLPHIAPSDIRYPPSSGWPEITQESLQAIGLRKTDQVVELLRHLPYLNGQYPWVAPDAYVVDYCKAVTEQKTYPFRPLELSKPLSGPPGEGNLVKPWVVEITSGTLLFLSIYLHMVLTISRI